MAEGFTFYRDRDGTLCRCSPHTRYEVWWPDSQEWAPYFWNSCDVVEISAEQAAAGWGAAAIR